MLGRGRLIRLEARQLVGQRLEQEDRGRQLRAQGGLQLMLGPVLDPLDRESADLLEGGCLRGHQVGPVVAIRVVTSSPTSSQNSGSATANSSCRNSHTRPERGSDRRRTTAATRRSPRNSEHTLVSRPGRAGLRGSARFGYIGQGD